MIKEVESKIVLDDYGKNLKLIWSSDKMEQVKSSYASTQWHKFKTGTKNRLYNYVINDKAFNYEYVLKFEMDSVVMLNEVQIGVVYNWSTYDPDCNVEPLSILVEGGVQENIIDWRAIVHPVKDDGFSMNSITLYGVNFTETSNITSFDLENVLSKIGSRQAKYINFRLRKPVLTCTDQSVYLA